MYSFGSIHIGSPLTQGLPVIDPLTGDRVRETVLYESNRLSIVDRVQMGPKQGWGPTQGGGRPAIVFLRAGLMECKTTREYVFTDTTYVKCYDAAHEYRRQRLQDGGEAFTLVHPDPELMGEAFGRAGYQAACPSDIHYRHLKLYRMLREREVDRLAVDEMTLELLADVATAFGAEGGVAPASPAMRRRLQAAQAYVAADPAHDHRLADVADIAGCSEFHFARLFKAETGYSLRAYRKRLRMRLALKLISEGQEDLSSVAMDAGFATHSHMTATFQAEMGRTPSAARAGIALTQ